MPEWAVRGGRPPDMPPASPPPPQQQQQQQQQGQQGQQQQQQAPPPPGGRDPPAGRPESMGGGGAHVDYLLIEVPRREAYGRLRLCRSMVRDHFLPGYIRGLDAVAARLEASLRDK
jgi:hypothetical protein